MHAMHAMGGMTVNPAIFAGKPIIRGRRLAVEHVLGMLAARDSHETGDVDEVIAQLDDQVILLGLGELGCANGRDRPAVWNGLSFFNEWTLR